MIFESQKIKSGTFFTRRQKNQTVGRIVEISLICLVSALGLSAADNREISTLLDKQETNITRGSKKKKAESIATVRDDLDAMRRQKKLPNRDQRQRLSRMLIKSFEDKTLDKQSTEDIVTLLAVYGDDVEAKNFVFDVLRHGSKEHRMAAMGGLTRSETAIPKRESIQVISELYQKGIIDGIRELAMRSALDPEATLPEVRETVRETKDKETFRRIGDVLQTYQNPAYLSDILLRLKEFEMDKPYKDFSNGVFWIDQRLHAEFLKAAEGRDLKSALELLDMGGGSQARAIPIIKERDLINHSDPDVRKKASWWLREGGSGGLLDLAEIKGMIQRRLEIEKDEQVKQALKDRLNEIAFSERARKRRENKATP